MAGVVDKQPGAPPAAAVYDWMPAVASSTGCPPGLEYLTKVDQLVVKQEVNLLEAFTGYEQNNKYRVFNSMGQQVYYAREDATCVQRQFCGSERGFTIYVTDNSNKVVLKFVREFKCCAGCCWCADRVSCAFQVQVLTPDDELLGIVQQAKYCCAPRILALNADNSQIGMFKGPCCICDCPCNDVNFPLVSTDGVSVIGNVSKQWSGAAKEIFTDADNFCVTFPMDMDVRAKAVIFGATFLIDMMFFEDDGNDKNS